MTKQIKPCLCGCRTLGLACARMTDEPTVTEATQHGAQLALNTQDVASLATYGFQGVSGFEGSGLDAVCRNAAQDEAKRLAE